MLPAPLLHSPSLVYMQGFNASSCESDKGENRGRSNCFSNSPPPSSSSAAAAASLVQSVKDGFATLRRTYGV